MDKLSLRKAVREPFKKVCDDRGENPNDVINKLVQNYLFTQGIAVDCKKSSRAKSLKVPLENPENVIVEGNYEKREMGNSK